MKTSDRPLWARLSSQSSADELHGIGLRNVRAALKLGRKELDMSGQLVPATIYWVCLECPAEFPKIAGIEGKFYVPDNPLPEKSLVHYGMSALIGNTGRFEQRYAREITRAGYYLFTPRHNGTALLTTHANEVVNSVLRQKCAERLGETHIGGARLEGYTPLDMLDEPVTSLIALATPFAAIYQYSQSFGTSATYCALQKLAKHGHTGILKRLKTIVNAAGYVGKYVEHEPGIWDMTKIPAQKFAEHQVTTALAACFNYTGTIDSYLQQMAVVAKGNGELEVPDHIGNIFLTCPQDPMIVGPSDNRPETLAVYGPTASRKLFISMEAPAGDRRPHSFDFLPTSDLLKLLTLEVKSHSSANSMF